MYYIYYYNIRFFKKYKDMSKKIVRISENELVNLIENIVNEAVAEKKNQWIAENEAKKETLLESKVAKLEAAIDNLTKGK